MAKLDAYKYGISINMGHLFLRKKLAMLYLFRFETIIHGTHEEAEEMLKDIGTDSKIANELAQQLIIMKRLL